MKRGNEVTGGTTTRCKVKLIKVGWGKIGAAEAKW